MPDLGVLKAETWRAKRWGPHFSARDFSALFLPGSASARGRVARRSQPIQPDIRIRMPKQPAAGNAGVAPSAIGRHWPGVPEPGP